MIYNFNKKLILIVFLSILSMEGRASVESLHESIVENDNHLTKNNFKSLNPSTLNIEEDLINPRDTLKEFFEIFIQAKQHTERAVNCLAGFYYEGAIVRKNIEKGIGLYLWSAETLKSPNAMYKLSEIFEKDNPNECEKWKKMAACCGHFEAAQEIGLKQDE